MKFKIKPKDSFRPQVGIFEYLDNKLLILTDNVDTSTAVLGMVDARNMFHRDLMKMASQDETLNPKTREFIIKNNYNVYRYYPRGRVCYQVNEDKYYIFGPVEILNDSNRVEELISEFSLPKDKVILSTDPEYTIVEK